MAQQIHISLTDDIDGKEASGTTTFALDGVTYEIDLSDANRAKLDKALKPFIENGRKVKGGSKARSSAKGGSGKGTGEAAAIRVWATANGISVPAKGRIPADVREQYEAHHAA
jgi:hypothetical protein